MCLFTFGTVCQLLHSCNDLEFLLDPFNFLTFLLGLPLAFLYRAFCYRKNTDIQVTISFVEAGLSLKLYFC